MNQISINSILKFLVFGFFAYLFFLIVKPFFPSIILALALAMIFFPLKKKLKQAKMGDGWAAFLTVVITFIFIALPLAALITLLTQEALRFAQSEHLAALQEALSHLSTWNFFGYQVDLGGLKENILSGLSSLGSYLSGKSLSILSVISNSLFLFFVFLLLYFYFLRDAETLLKNLKTLLPYTSTEQKKLTTSFHEISRTIFYGNLLSALLAGVVAYMGFLIFGFKGALIWALLAFIFSFIPTLGTLLIYMAGMLILVFTSGWLAALLMLIYFVFIELLVRENWIRGKLLEDKLNFHPILVFFAIVGGVTAFGSLGLIYGPLIITFLGAFYQFYLTKSKD